MKYLLLILCSIALTASAQSYFDNDTSLRVFTKEELAEDIRYCRHFHEKHNSNLYAYHSEAYMDSLFDALERNVAAMNAMAFFNYLAPITEAISDGHCLLIPPSDFTTISDQSANYFPFRVHKTYVGFYVTLDLSKQSKIFGDGRIPIGEINGISVDTIYNNVIRTLPREGNNMQYPDWIIDKYFYEYYSYVYGHPDTFELSITIRPEEPHSTGGVLMLKEDIAAIPKDSLVERRKTLYPEYPFTKARDKGLYFTRYDSVDAAVFTLFTWDKEILKKVYGIKFKDSVDAYMQTMINDSIGTLIIDLRNNQGGLMRYGKYMMQWLMDTSFNYIDGLYKVRLKKNGERVYRSVQNKQHTAIRPKKNNYTGDIIILTNGGSFSNSSIFTTQMQRYGRAQVMGEETGGSATQLTGSFGLVRPLIMPNSKIEMTHINYRIVLQADKPYSGAGVQPDMFIEDVWTPEKGDLLLQQVLTGLAK